MTEQTLSGSCSCGRFQYTVLVPSDTSQAQVHFGTGRADRRSQASLLSAWLRVPIQCYRSSTVSFFPDENHNTIAKTFIPVEEPSCQRKFCGFCGTHLSYWTDEHDEQDFMNVTLGSLGASDLQALDEMGILDRAGQDEQPREGGEVAATGAAPVRSIRQGQTGDIAWFEEMIQGSELGQHKYRRRGHGQSADGTTTVTWEVSEYFDTEDSPKEATAKRRKVEVEDTSMKD